MRVGIYARYSSDNQRDASIEHQVRSCRTRADREGWSVVEIFDDRAISGTEALRPGYQRMLAEMRSGHFDVILAESLDRLSRDLEHVAAFHKQASFAGARIVTLAEGEVTELHVGVKGAMGAIYLKDLAQKTHRGLEGRVLAGKSGGGLCFGYRVVRRLGPKAEPVTGEREIDADAAAVVRRIFAEYVAGRSPRTIARALNGEGVHGPRGGRWTASLILGNAERETGILRNRLYAGELVWNRQHFVKDPVTSKRVARPNPREQWIVRGVPDLRIVDDETWRAAQQRLQEAHQRVAGRRGTARSPEPLGERLAAQNRPGWLLSGLVRCGLCGGPMSVVGSGGRLGCANHRERDTCTNRRTLLRDPLVARVLDGLKQRLLAPELVEQFAREFIAEINAANRERGQRQARIEQERFKVDRQIRNALELTKEGMGSRSLVEELRALEQRQDELAAQIEAAGRPEPVPALHPNLAQVYRDKVARLEAALADPVIASEATEALRSVIDAIVIYPGERRGEVRIELRGDLAAFLRMEERRRNVGSGEVVGSLVAGARNHLDLLLTG
jgi:site-specific DNA recombinase